MKLKVEFFIFFTAAVMKLNHGNYLDKVNLKDSLIFTREVQELRNEMHIFQENSLMEVEKSFFDLYNNFAEELYRYFDKLNETEIAWKNFCQNFPTTSLNTPELRRFFNTCDDIAKFMRKLKTRPEIYLRKLHPKPFEKVYPVRVFEVLFENLDSLIGNASIKSMTKCSQNVRLSIILNYEVLVNQTIELHETTIAQTNQYTKYFTKFVLNFIEHVRG